MAIIIKPLTDTEIRKATPEKSPLRDGEGLFLDISQYSKKWRLDYKRPFTKKRTSITLGNYPTMSLKEAREKKAELRALLAQDIDPKEYRDRKKREYFERLEGTFYKVALEWKKFKAKQVMPQTLAEDWQRLENHIFPTLRNAPISQINAKMLVDTLQKVYRKGHTSVIEKSLRTIENIMDYAENRGLIEMHNCHKAKKAFVYKPAENNPTIADSELPKFILAILTAPLKPQTKHLIFWQLLTAVRPAEAVSVEWSEIDWANRCWRIPAEKMKGRRNKKRPHNVPLSTQAIALLERMRAFSGRQPFVFPHFKFADRSMSSETVNMAIKRNGYDGKMTSHGFRALISTHLNAQGFHEDVIETVLAHEIRGKTRRVYNRHDYFNERIPVMQYWGDFIEQNGLNWEMMS